MPITFAMRPNFPLDQKDEIINENDKKKLKIDPESWLWFPKTPFFEALCTLICF